MIEKFTQEEIEQIKKELSIGSPYNGSKKTILDKQYRQVQELFTTTDGNKNSYAKMDVWNALTVICDHTIENYYVRENRMKQMTRYQSIYRIDEYRTLMDELLKPITQMKRIIAAEKGDEVE